ncbi:hypothetical protein [Lysinibacillus sp. fls2-241-R2A-57]|uniref:hypothetical protein n=1 Tax=Lysinibacillus sp. fls2-241-R2A-57 TaxID=3040292 RepID=UPI0025534E4E|nr:hypothetical protein [Lysinibacillus sp. fls2-241-R2A-57]
MSNPENEKYRNHLLVDIAVANCKKNINLDSQSNFKWEYKEGYFCTTSQEVDSFFKLLVSYNCNDEFNDEDDIKEDFEEIRECFLNDIVIEVLTESVEELNKQLKNKVVQNKYKDLIGELFYTVREMESCIKQVNFECLKDNIEVEDIIDKLYALKNSNSNANNEFLKILTPWIVFVLLLTSKKREVNFEKLYKYLKLINPKYSKEFSEIEVYNNSRKSFNLFMYLLNENKHAVNKSLCLNILNKYTDFFDIDNLVKTSSYISSGNEDNKDKIERFKFITKIDSFSVKNMLIKGSYSFYLLNYQDIWETYSVLFNKCKESLKGSIDILKETTEFKLELPEEIRSNYLIYKLFSNEDPYDYLIDDEDKDEQFDEKNQRIDNEEQLNYEYISLLEKIKQLQIEEYSDEENNSICEALDSLIEEYHKYQQDIKYSIQNLKEEEKQSIEKPFTKDYTIHFLKTENKHSIKEYEYVYQMIYNEKYKK